MLLLFQGQEEFPLVEHQNSCYLFQMVELLQNSQVPLGVEAGSEEQAGFCRHLEQRAFLLSEEVPLFVLSMWRIGKLLSSDR
ncbi:hypothetical protein PBY51_006408 [Eleginops maclovinus]|uniref:Uncharacterized protein n=1 Tax=Eleginops maclovinus TaxID=56733 RepID=A0AAN7X1K4_ELEMC|nr:hypothetical protein PBY51_006408 [Eleginops maclovinus]